MTEPTQEQFEELWTNKNLGSKLRNVVCDTMVRQHIINNRQSTALSVQSYLRYGSTVKEMVDREKLAETPLDIVARYNVLDCRYTLRLKQDQDKELNADTI